MEMGYCNFRRYSYSVAYHGVVETSSAVVTREGCAVDDLVFTAGAGKAGSTVALIAAETDVTTDGSVHTRLMRRAVVQVYNVIITHATYP